MPSPGNKRIVACISVLAARSGMCGGYKVRFYRCHGSGCAAIREYFAGFGRRRSTSRCLLITLRRNLRSENANPFDAK
jgi:hypothetical protein